MAKKLKLGTSFIRLSLAAGVLISGAGIYCSLDMATTPELPARIKTLATIAVIGFSLNLAITGIVFLMLVTRNLLKRVGVIAKVMEQGTDGNLTARVEEADDELGLLGRTFNSMLQKLAGMATKMSQSITELQQISTSIRDVSSRSLASAEIHSEGVMETSGAVQDINRSVQDVAQAVESLSSSADENAAFVHEMSASINSIMSNVQSLSGVVEEVSASILEMTATEKQIGSSVNSLMEDSTATAAMVAQMDSSIKQIELNAQQTALISERVRTDAETGREAVEATISGIGEIHRSSRITFDAIQNLSARTGDIGKMLSVIDEVAAQTNLLSLNASIIAAQAGEHGKGFAVVAEEIKGLSRRTSNSIQEITDIIKGVQEETARAVNAIRLSEMRISEGETLSQRSGEALKKIVEGVMMATDQVGMIAQTTVEQAQGSKNMRLAMERVSEMVQQIARATREQGHGNELIMAAVEQMKDLTEHVLTSTVEQTNSSQMIVKSTENISTMIGSIRYACAVQSESGGKIVHAVEQIQRSNNESVESTRIMDSALTGLSRQIELLRKEMSWFKV